jgi:hypothetical protein
MPNMTNDMRSLTFYISMNYVVILFRNHHKSDAIIYVFNPDLAHLNLS